jgi:hypothetical protein
LKGVSRIGEHPFIELMLVDAGDKRDVLTIAKHHLLASKAPPVLVMRADFREIKTLARPNFGFEFILFQSEITSLALLHIDGSQKR